MPLLCNTFKSNCLHAKQQYTILNVHYLQKIKQNFSPGYNLLQSLKLLSLLSLLVMTRDSHKQRSNNSKCPDSRSLTFAIRRMCECHMNVQRIGLAL